MNPNFLSLFFQWFPALLAFAFGLCIGSFLNVCILRLPKGLSIVRPPSRCPQCKTPLRWQDNIPLISYAILRGRCRNCGKKISWQYPLVEGLTGCYFLSAYLRFQADDALLGWITALGAASILFSGIEIENHILPPRIILPVLALAGLLAPLNSWLGLEWKGRLLQMALGLLAAGLLWAVRSIKILFPKWDGVGLGDVGVMALFGMSLGWERAMGGLFLASILCVLSAGIVLALGRRGKKITLPLGPFLSAGCLAVAFYPPSGLAYWLA